MERPLNWSELVVESLRAPGEAARSLLAMGLGRDALYTALFAVSAANALLAAIPSIIAPDTLPFPGILGNPLVLFLLVAGILVVSVNIFYWAGRALGGEAAFEDVMAVLVWLQALRALAQIIILVVGLIAPAMAALMALVVMVYGIYILLHFLNVAFRYGSLMRAAALLVAVIIGMVFGMTILLSLIGVSNLGLPANV